MKILSRPKGNAEEYGRWSVNPYLGCPNDCQYCYLKKGPGAKVLGGDKPTLKSGVVSEEHAYHLAMAEILENQEQIKKDGGLFFTFTSDPCLPETCELTFRIAADAMNYGIPVTLLTKDAHFCDGDRPVRTPMTRVRQLRSWIEIIEIYQTYKELLAIGFTLTGHDELEPNASTNADRLEAVGYLSLEGYKVWASIEPVIDFASSYDMIKEALWYGCQHFKIGLMTKNTKVCRKGFSFGGHDFAPYDPAECLEFIKNVMRATDGRATVYWKQSFVDYLEGPSKKDPQPLHGVTVREFLSQWPHSVGKDWSMFNNNIKV